MFYEFPITITANTLESVPKEQELKLCAGVIQKVHCLFAPGPHAMVAFRLMEGGHQYLPTNPDGDIASDDEVWKADDEYYELGAPYILKFVGYSPGTTYPHTLRLRIGILRPEDVEKQSGMLVALNKFLKLVGLR